MKKTLSIALILVLVLSLMLPTAALADYHDYEVDGLELDCTDGGLRLFLPHDWVFNTLGTVDVMMCKELGYNSGVYATVLG